MNFSFITKDDGDSFMNYKKFTQPVVDALAKMGVNAELSGRNDILAEGRKVSGNAQFSKTPISVIEMLLQDERPLDKKNVQEEIDRLRRGLDMVLVNARLENFEEDMQVEQIPLKTIVTATVNENKRLFITNRVFPEIHIEDDIIVASDSKWLRFIIGQFVTNAVKYTFEENKKDRDVCY
ncbi:hypothetical protein LSPH24S_09851 [Lysinibacillus sphaericus]